MKIDITRHFGPQYYSSLHRGCIYVLRNVNGTEVPLLINPAHYREWVGCFSAL